MASGGELDRRTFLVAASVTGGGLALGFAIPFVSRSEGVARAAEDADVTCWVDIAPDNTVTIRIARAEMGQGALTGLAMLVAEELECDWARVKTEFVSPTENLRRNQIWGDTATGASRSIASSQHYLRRAGATAREMLIAAAAARWHVPAAQCAAQNSTIVHTPSGQTLTFGAVAEAAAKDRAAGQYRIETATGLETNRHAAQSSGRIRQGHGPAGLCHRRAAAEHAVCRHRAVPGLRRRAEVSRRGVDRRHGGCARHSAHAGCGRRGGRFVVAGKTRRSTHCASIGTTAAISKFRAPRLPRSVRAGLDAAAAQVGSVHGDVAAALGRAVRRVEAEYTVPFLAHATMEPQTCTAHVTSKGVEIWAPTQEPATALATAALAAGVPNDKVTVHRMMLGGGFGRRAPIQEYVRQAVVIAKEFEEPVKLVWSREQDIAHDLYRPFGMARLVAGLDADGMPVAWTIRLAGPSFVASLVPEFGANIIDRTFVSGLAEEMPYDVPNYLVDYVVRPTPVPLGVWRAINYTQNAFYKECFVDEMAHAAGIDPYQYRRRLLRNSRRILPCSMPRRSRADWGTPLPAGVYRGIALNEACGSYCAQVVEASVSDGQRARASRRVGARPRPRRQSAVDRDADARRDYLRADRGVVWRDYHQERRRRAIQLRHLPDAAHRQRARRSRP